MNISIESLFFVLVTVMEAAVSFDHKCPPLVLLNGRSRYTWRGRSVRFNCKRGYQLVGVKYATCMNGKWDADVPVCVKFGCRAPSTNHVNGQFIESYRGAVVKIVCNPGYTLVGSPSVYCNGFHWNETFPLCLEFSTAITQHSLDNTFELSNSSSVFQTPSFYTYNRNYNTNILNKNPAQSCDFEESLCGWNQDPMHDFDWKWTDGSDSGIKDSNHTDQTRDSKNTGLYMYMVRPRSSRTENETARLYSPVYPPILSNKTCFSFRFLMRNSTTSMLKIYVKPEGVELSNLIPDFWMTGNQGESWQNGFFSIDLIQSPFQIVIEGIRGSVHIGDIAFDDVKLLNSEECLALQIMTSTQMSSSVTSDNVGTEPGNVACECPEGSWTCPPEYYYSCSSTDLTSTTTPSEEIISTTSRINVSNDNNQMDNEINSGRTEIEISKNRSLNEIEQFHNKSKEINTKDKNISEETLGKKIEKAAGHYNQSSATTTPATTTPATTLARAFVPFKPNKMSFVGENESRFHKGKSKEPLGKEPPEAIKIDRNEENSSKKIRGMIELGGSSIGILIIIVLGIVWYRRRRSRKLERDNMVEDSDVRYLTSDEVLDFTLARPADDDL